MKRKVSFALVVVIGTASDHFRSAFLTKFAGMIGYIGAIPAFLQVILALATFISAIVVVWNRWTDKPKLEIKVEDRTRILDEKYSIEVPILNKGRRDAYNCSISVQLFNRKSGKKVGESSTSQSQLKPGEKGSSFSSELLPFNGDFVARISAETHKSKTDKIIGYSIKINSEDIIFKQGIIQSLKFKAEKFLRKKYRDEWDVDLLSNGLKSERFSEPELRTKIIVKLGNTGVKAVNPLIDCLEKDTNRKVRGEIARTLGNIGDERAVEPLLRCLLREDREINVQRCGEAIAKIGAKKSVTPLIQILKDGSLESRRRKAAAEALGIIGIKIKDESIEEALIETLEDSEKDVRCTVAEALGKVGSEKALDALLKNEHIKEECGEQYKETIEQIQFRIKK